MTTSRRFALLAERDINRETFVEEWAEAGLMVVDSPFDPKPSLRVVDGRVEEMDGKQRADFDAKVVDESAAPGQQSGVFDALDRLAAPTCWQFRHSLDVSRCALEWHNRANALTLGGGGTIPPPLTIYRIVSF